VSDIFREIDDELRRDNFLKLWQRYGRYVIAAIVVALLVAGGIVAWRNHQLSERQAQSERYAAAMQLLRESKNADAAKLFASVAAEGGGYSALADFEDADLAAVQGDSKGAVADYDRLAASPNVDPQFHDIAILLSVMNGFADGDPHAAIDRLKPLTETGNPWRALALEVTAAAQLKAGDTAAAADSFKKLADDPTTPDGVRSRAAEMSAALKP
jgi:hypothetical protein